MNTGGYEQNSDGSYNFFIKGVDRFILMLQKGIVWITQFVNAFLKDDILWKSFQTIINEFVNNNGGKATILPIIKNRPDCKKEDKVLKGERSLSELGCN
ncbi:hypothetical protein [Gelidibacter maritimus]|uniref:Uncharacterized protein n=1 Tax=Gelidibacter maritimus TaxID=2761487 RepID=A0A7W2M797_9FLAO|nr:hypothetical protein [Gelidibacter maritimus]MBA6154029.1 hypothetical protein [Gelidibacter maritimus]